MNWYIPTLESDEYDALDYVDSNDDKVLSYFWGFDTSYDPEAPGGFRSNRLPYFPDTWQPIQVEKYPAKKADILSLVGFMTITQHALSYLKPLLGEAILLPVFCGEEILYVVREEEIDCLNYEKAIVDRYDNGAVSEIEEFALLHQKLEGKHIFRFPEIIITSLVSQTFKDVVEQNNLFGMSFRKITELI
ncbi:imm11 family protein [Alkalinema pantanalense CENA528]|uniref:imm11 family protein n=1 Tax=Alkalinema pantanalense TaxID=1620705 RepID=UPI003D6F563A